jgi:uncharacterized protein (DUF433 family)
MEPILTTYVELRPNREGQQRAYLAGTRVRVQDVATMADRRGLSPEEIVRSLPQLSLGQVHAALAYYFDHREAILEELRQDDQFLEQFRGMTGPGPLEQLLRSTDAKPDSFSP